MWMLAYSFKISSCKLNLKCVLKRMALSLQATIADSSVTNNNAYIRGGGMVVWNDYPRAVSVSNSTFSVNNASYGGGMSIVSNSSTVCTNLVVFNNSASDNGGGIELADSAQVSLISMLKSVSL